MTAVLPGVLAHLAVREVLLWSPVDPYPVVTDMAVGVLGALPPAPDRVVALTTYAGSESNSNEPYTTSFVQVRVRGTDQESVSRDLAQRVHDELHGLGVTELPDVPAGVRLVNAVALQGGPIYIGTDANGRHEHVVNMRWEWRNPASLAARRVD